MLVYTYVQAFSLDWAFFRFLDFFKGLPDICPIMPNQLRMLAYTFKQAFSIDWGKVFPEWIIYICTSILY